jgi:hypothetical protein
MRCANHARRNFLVALGVVFTAAAVPQLASAAGTPVQIRIVKGSREGAPGVDPRLDDVKSQLSKLAYVRWDVAGEHQATLDVGKSTSVALPEGGSLEVTLVEQSGNRLTFQLKGGGASSRLTISRDQRIVQQVTGEKNGAAYFATIRPG